MNMNVQPSQHDLLFGAIVIAIGSFTTAFTIVFAIWRIVRPGEHDPRHPKNMILRNDR